MGAKSTVATMIPAVRYEDADAAVDWLYRAFGFVPHAVYRDDGGKVVHAELSFGHGMMMLGPNVKSEFGRLMTLPNSVGGLSTQATYVIVDDADAHHARAVAAGATIVIPLKDEDYGGRGYSCRDPEGHIWSFGTYDPWAQASGATG